jgi:multidrug efflux pump
VIYGALARFTRSPDYTARKIEEWEALESTANDAVPAAAE